MLCGCRIGWKAHCANGRNGWKTDTSYKFISSGETLMVFAASWDQRSGDAKSLPV